MRIKPRVSNINTKTTIKSKPKPKLNLSQAVAAGRGTGMPPGASRGAEMGCGNSFATRNIQKFCEVC